MALLDDVATLVVAAGIAVEGTTLFKGRLPEDPDAAMALEDYGGRTPLSAHDGRTRRFARLQVLVRDRDPELARSRSEAVWQLFLSTQGMTRAALTLNGTEYETMLPLGEPFKMTFDTTGRTVMACNYEVRRSQ